MYKLRLQSVDSREAREDELADAGIIPDELPTGWRIMAQQAKTIRALRYGDAPIIINQAMTGDGKTIAGRFTLFNDGFPTLAMYPTNELVADQAHGLDEQLEDWPLPYWKGKRPVYDKLNASKLDELQTDLGLSRAATLKLLLNNDLLLTNPDIFHLMIQFAYRRHGMAPDRVLTELVQRYQLFVFDEFHLFGAPQTAAVLIAMLLMRAIGSAKRPARFLFLSATPQEMLGHLAGLVNLKTEYIRGDYRHGLTDEQPGWRRILQTVDLNLHHLLYPERLENWLETHFEAVIKPFFAENQPAARGIIIANGLASAHRAFHYLQPLCDAAGIRLGINTGLTPIAQRDKVFDLLIATSTIDVGVDFRINLLVFESMDAASHIQRLGRLGRHRDDGEGNHFARFEAHALLPGWVVEGLQNKFPDSATIGREAYKTALDEFYLPLQQFYGYRKQWAGVQAAHVLDNLGKLEIKTQYEAVRKKLDEEFKILFPGGVRKYIGLRSKEGQQAVLDAALTFRDSSSFTALVVDPTGRSKEIVSYNLITLLRTADLLAEELEEFYRRVPDRTALARGNPLAAYRVVEWLSQPRSISFDVDRRLAGVSLETVLQMDGFRLDAPGVPELNKLNKTLEERPLAVLLLPGEKPDMLRKRFRLSYQLELFPFESTDGIRGCAAFGRDALLLDSIRFHQRQNDKQNNPLIY